MPSKKASCYVAPPPSNTPLSSYLELCESAASTDTSRFPLCINIHVCMLTPLDLENLGCS